MRLQKIINQIESSLTWKIRKTYITMGNEEILSDPWDRIHHITIPMHKHRDIEYLHELAHAVLAERHHLLATAIFAKGTPEKYYDMLVNPIRTASDWFADSLLMQWVPDLEQAEIIEHFRYCVQINKNSPDILYMGGLLLAQAVYYCGRSIDEAPQYAVVARILLRTDPGNPSVEAKRDLVNALAEFTCQQRIKLGQDDGFEVWIVR